MTRKNVDHAGQGHLGLPPAVCGQLNGQGRTRLKASGQNHANAAAGYVKDRRRPPSLLRARSPCRLALRGQLAGVTFEDAAFDAGPMESRDRFGLGSSSTHGGPKRIQRECLSKSSSFWEVVTGILPWARGTPPGRRHCSQTVIHFNRSALQHRGGPSERSPRSYAARILRHTRFLFHLLNLAATAQSNVGSRDGALRRAGTWYGRNTPTGHARTPDGATARRSSAWFPPRGAGLPPSPVTAASTLSKRPSCTSQR